MKLRYFTSCLIFEWSPSDKRLTFFIDCVFYEKKNAFDMYYIFGFMCKIRTIIVYLTFISAFQDISMKYYVIIKIVHVLAGKVQVTSESYE